MKKPIKAIVLSAGKGTRLGSETAGIPKAMRRAAGEPLLGHVLRELSFIPPEDIILVVGYMADSIKDYFGDKYRYAMQEEQRGTGHAAACGAKGLEGFDGCVLICYCDMPLISKDTYTALIEEHIRSNNVCTLMSGSASRYLPYGRILRDKDGTFTGVVEDKDCTPGQKGIKELNAGVYVFDCEALLSALSELKPNNAQGEYYLTDAPGIIKSKGGRVGVYFSRVKDEILGVNTAEDLAEIESILKTRM